MENIPHKGDILNIQVKYELNTVQNIKKAKANLIRSTQLTRMNIDDMNTKFEVHPGIYLEIKDKAKNIRQGMEFEDMELGVKVKVTRTRTYFDPFDHFISVSILSLMFLKCK